MNTRFLKNLAALFAAIAAAAAAQELCPPLLAGAKLPLLAVVATYYAVRRDAEWGAAAAAWCGALQDGFDSIGWGFGAPLFVALWALCHFGLKKQLLDNAYACAVVAAAFCAVREVVSFAALASNEDFAPAASAGLLFARLLAVTPVAALLAAGAAWLMRRADIALGNIEEEQHAPSYKAK